MVSLIAESTRCRFVITTYEGHAWERSVFANVRSKNPGVSCVGYQHAAIFKRQHGIFRRLAPAFQPDFVCTAGRVSRAVFIESGVYAEKNVLLLGSNRRGEVHCRLTEVRKAVCLVLPEVLEGVRAFLARVILFKVITRHSFFGARLTALRYFLKSSRYSKRRSSGTILFCPQYSVSRHNILSLGSISVVPP